MPTRIGLRKPYFSPLHALCETNQIRVGNFVFSATGVVYGPAEASGFGALFIHDIVAPLGMKHPYDCALAVDEDVDVVLIAGVAAHFLADGGTKAYVSSAEVHAPVEDVEPQILAHPAHRGASIAGMAVTTASTMPRGASF